MSDDLDTARAVLAKASLFDQTLASPDVAIAAVWAEAIAGIDRADALTAVTDHYSEPGPRRIMPGDVIAGVKRIRAERIRAASSAELEPHDVNPDDVVTYLEAGRARRARIAAGEPVEREPVPETTRPVAELLESTLKRLPKMPPALPQNDGRNNPGKHHRGLA